MNRYLLIVTLIAFVAIPALGTRPGNPPTTPDMTHAWFGFDNHRNFLRLDLKADGTGTLVWLQLAGESRTVFDIPKWEWSDSKWKLDFSIRPRRLADKDVWIRIESAGWYEIKISFGDKRAKWDRVATLMNERDVLEKLKLATAL